MFFYEEIAMFRFLVLTALFAGVSLPANAQFTTRSSTKTTQQPVVRTAPQQQAAPSFRPAVKKTQDAAARPSAGGAAASSALADDDDLPSFAPMTGRADPVSRQTPEKKVEPPKGEIWFYTANYKLDDSEPRFLGCQWSFVVQNRTNAELKRLVIRLKLKGVDFYYSLPGALKPGGASTTPASIFEQNCPIFRNAKPTIDSVKCRLENATSSYCQSLIVVK